MLLCYVTDRKQVSEGNPDSLRILLDRIARATHAGIDLIQLREKDLTARNLVEIGIRAAEIVREGNAGELSKPRTRLLINSRIDVAIACGAHGVQLPANDVSAADARAIFSKSGIDRPTIGVSCHTAQEVELAEGHGADFALFGPIFEKGKMIVQPDGIAELSRVCSRHSSKPEMPVIAVGGITLDNALQCLRAGATGIAAIRLFQSGNVAEAVSRLRKLAV